MIRYDDDYAVLVCDSACLTDGDVTIVKLKVEIDEGDFRDIYGSARRDPGDRSDAETGVLLAYGRAYSRLGRLLERRGNGRVRHADGVKQARAIAALPSCAPVKVAPKKKKVAPYKKAAKK